MDASGSEGSCMDQLETNITKITEQLQALTNVVASLTAPRIVGIENN